MSAEGARSVGSEGTTVTVTLPSGSASDGPTWYLGPSPFAAGSTSPYIFDDSIRACRMPGRKDRAQRPRRELVSTVLDHARERGPTGGEPDDVLTISVDVAAFDGRPTASASSRSARSTTTVARGTPGLSGTHRGREGRVGHAGGAQQRRTTTSFRRALFDLAVLGQKFRGFTKPSQL